MSKKCKFCSSSFVSKQDFQQHLETFHKDKLSTFMCSECGKQYKTKTELTHHIKSKCGTIKMFKCKVCSQELMSAGSLYNHMLRHNGQRAFMCRFCAKLFYTAGQLKVHERIHTQDKAYVCEVCNKGFCHRQSLITHSTLHTGIKPYQCENCGNSFSCVGNLIKHRKTHADTCGLIPLITHRVKHPPTRIKVKINTPENIKLKQHKKTSDKNATENEDKEQTQGTEVGPENREKAENSDLNQTKSGETRSKPNKQSRFDKELEEFTKCRKLGENKCKFCGKTYSNIRWLFKHEKGHKISGKPSENVKVNKCSCCKMIFDTKSECLDHQQQKHVSQLSCAPCEKMFANRDSLRSHQKVFHKGTPRKVYTYICDKCGKQFKQKSQLTSHEESNCDKGPVFECLTCHKHFSSKHTRNNHMRVHEPEKKLLCKFCAKSFHWKGQLKIHERSHTGEKPFTCLYCPKAFAYRESLITHSTLHTGIKPHLCEGCGSRFSCIGNLIKHRSSHVNECGAWSYKNRILQ